VPSQALAAATLVCSGYGACPKCLVERELFTLSASVVGDDQSIKRIASDTGCVFCLSEVAISERIKVSDVVDLGGKTQRRRTNKLARKREAACAEEIGGHTPPASGGGIAKGDARNDKWMIDDKHTRARQFTLKEADVRKLIGDSSKTGRRGALKVGFRNGEGCEVAVVHWPDFMEMIDGESD